MEAVQLPQRRRWRLDHARPKCRDVRRLDIGKDLRQPLQFEAAWDDAIGHRNL